MVESQGIVLKGGREAEIVTAAVPEPAGRQVLVKTHAVGLCGSDLSLYSGQYEGPKNYPIYFGHEWSGIVAAVGPEVSNVKPGDKVLFGKYSGTEVKIDGEELLVMREDDIMAVIE